MIMETYNSNFMSITLIFTTFSILVVLFIKLFLKNKYLKKYGERKYHPVAGTIFHQQKKHTEVQERVAEEVRKVTDMKGGENAAEFAASLSEDLLNKMQYLQAVLTETLRLYPAVPVDGKICFSDDTLPDGYSVKRRDLVTYQPYAMGRMRFIWGDDAEDFRPERWLDKNCIFQPESPFKFTAFQAGPRICIGKEFAYKQMKIFSAVLLRSFIFKLCDEESAVNYRTMITLHIDGGLFIRAIPRE